MWSLFPGTPIIVFTGDNAENYLSWGSTFPGDNLDFIKTKTINRNKHSVQLANTCDKNFGATNLKSQPNTPEIQRLSLSLIKTFLPGRRNYHFISTAKMYKRLLKTDKNKIIPRPQLANKCITQCCCNKELINIHEQLYIREKKKIMVFLVTERRTTKSDIYLLVTM